MMKYMLRFADEAEATGILYTETDGTLTPNYFAIDTLGILYEAAPEPVPEDYVPVEIPGWHVNVMSEADAPELEPYIVDPPPLVPRRVWA